MTPTRALKNQKRYYDKNRALLCSKLAKRRTTVRGRAQLILGDAKKRAKQRNEPFTLTVDHVIEGLKRGICPRTGYWFDLSPTGGTQHPLAPSLDRIDASKPYSDGNVQVVCWQYNTMKHTLTDAELLEFCKAIVRMELQ